MKSEKNKKRSILALAPMAGITDHAFRLICKEYGADLLYSEMVSATGLSKSRANNIHLVNSCQQDFPLIVQLFGANPEDFAVAAKVLDKLPEIDNTIDDTTDDAIGDPIEASISNQSRRPEGIDINFGCPVKKVVKQGAGSALMADLKRSRKVIKAVCENTSLPVSIKIRAGVGKVGAMEFLENIGDLDWGSVMIHGRTFQQGFAGPIDFELICEIKGKFPTKKIIANGGVMSPENAKEVLDKTGADGIGIARGALGAPWLFSGIKEFLETGTCSPVDLEQRKKTALFHARLTEKFKGEKGILEFRKHLGWYFKGLPGAKKVRLKLWEVDSWEKIKQTINSF